MGAPTKGHNWEIYGKRDLSDGIWYEKWYDGFELEHHIHLPNGTTILFQHDPGDSAKILVPVKPHPCARCGRDIEFPAFDDLEPFYKYHPKYERAVLKHAWEYHREDFPPQFRTFSEFLRWIKTPEGRAWDQKRWSLADKDEVMAEAERIIRGGDNDGNI